MVDSSNNRAVVLAAVGMHGARTRALLLLSSMHFLHLVCTVRAPDVASRITDGQATDVLALLHQRSQLQERVSILAISARS